MSNLNYWKFLAGVGLFLYGMDQLEDTLKELAGKRFKLFLKKYTHNKVLAIINGTIATTILQSSSIILLMVIAFAGAGILSLSNSLGIILGANLGTTMTGWLVSLIGFSFKLESLVFPLIGLGSLGLLFTNQKFYLRHLFALIVAIGLLFMGLDYMKESMGVLAKDLDIKAIAKFGSWAFFLSGFVVTALIQSSSAMMTIILSAMFAKIITLEPAAYMAIGADLGTTITGLLASFNGTAVKKRVGVAHFFLNIGTAVTALILIKPILFFLETAIKFQSQMFTLVAFHSFFNFLGVIIFFPFLGLFERFLNGLFVKNEHACQFVHKVSTNMPEAALAVIRLELTHLLNIVFNFNVRIIGMKNKIHHPSEKGSLVSIQQILVQDDYDTEYEHIKNVEGELLVYLASLQREKLDEEESNELNKYILSLRNSVQSAKAAKDIEHNFKEFRQSVIREVENLTHKLHEEYLPVLKRINSNLLLTGKTVTVNELEQLSVENENVYKAINQWIYETTKLKNEADFHVPTFLNVNREIYSANNHFIEAMKDLVNAKLA